MTAPQIFRIPLVPMSRNERDRAHWAKRARELNDWTLMIPMCVEAFRQQEGDPRRLIEIVYCKKRGPESDQDNLTARAKVPLDALIRRQWAIDDSPKYIDLRVSETTDARATQTIIAISEGAA